MTELALSVAEPFSSPAWGSNFVVFTSEAGAVIPETLTKAYLNRACRYARHHAVHLVPERFMLLGYQCMCLIAPTGEVVGAQKGLYLNLANRIGKRGTALEIFGTPFGEILLCVDADIYHPEISRFASDMGAKYIICSQYITKAEYGSHLVVSGCWNASQLGRMYVIGVSGQFNCVCAPIPISLRGDGFIVTPSLKLPMTARLHAEKLAAVRKPAPLSRKFYAVHRSELIG